MFSVGAQIGTDISATYFLISALRGLLAWDDYK